MQAADQKATRRVGDRATPASPPRSDTPPIRDKPSATRDKPRQQVVTVPSLRCASADIVVETAKDREARRVYAVPIWPASRPARS